MKIFKYLFEAIFVYFLFLIIKICGLNLGRKVMAPLFLFFGFFFKSKKIVRENIYTALGKIPEKEIDNIIKSMWKNYAYIFVEYIYLYKYRFDKFSTPIIKIKGKEILENLIRENKQAIFISGHFGNFELMAMQLEKNKINLGAIYRPLNNIFLNPFMVSLRKKYICKNQIEKGKKGTRQVMELMKKKFSIALMVDQRLGESERYPFFHKPAHTTTLPAQLSLKYNCSIIPIYTQRNKDNTFELEILNPIKINKVNNSEESKKEITIKINKVIEQMVLRNPKQWIWTHNRWK
tara:strand:- start:967 stop:1842 length:876 start_codon:yes stop_codon:yes gene_type:complete